MKRNAWLTLSILVFLFVDPLFVWSAFEQDAPPKSWVGVLFKPRRGYIPSDRTVVHLFELMNTCPKPKILQLPDPKISLFHRDLDELEWLLIIYAPTELCSSENLNCKKLTEVQRKLRMLDGRLLLLTKPNYFSKASLFSDQIKEIDMLADDPQPGAADLLGLSRDNVGGILLDSDCRIKLSLKTDEESLSDFIERVVRFLN